MVTKMDLITHLLKCLGENPGMLVDRFERTFDGKLKCRYCNYASKGAARLIEHIRIRTDEKPHRCHFYQFASAYEHHLETRCIPILEINRTNVNRAPSTVVIAVTCPIIEGTDIKWYQLKVPGLP